MGILTYFIRQFGKNQIDSLREQIDDRRHMFEEQKDELEYVRGQISNIKSSMAKTNIVLLSRINDYAKELEFWRNTMRKAVLDDRKDKSKAEKILAAVTDNLNTFGTRTKQPNFEHVKTLASYIADVERRTGKEDTSEPTLRRSRSAPIAP